MGSGRWAVGSQWGRSGGRVQPERRSQDAEPVLVAVAEELGLGGQVVDAVQDERWRVAEEPGGGRRVEE